VQTPPASTELQLQLHSSFVQAEAGEGEAAASALVDAYQKEALSEYRVRLLNGGFMRGMGMG